MRTTETLLATLREAPADAEVISHQLMLRAGMIRKTAAGIYNWLPFGLRVLRKVETIVREEMDASGAQEVLLCGVQPAELWRESRRWDEYGPELLRFKDRHERDFCLAPTHEEIITDLIRHEIRSYKQLPANFYQIQTKFRDEIRPRFGIMRAREFLMKDGYSFHLSQQSLEQTYQLMYRTYTRIFNRLGLEFRPVLADSGNIGGKVSHEFHVLADSGEDSIAFSEGSEFATNVELIAAPLPWDERPEPLEALQKTATPAQHTIEDISRFFQVSPARCLKTLIVNGNNDDLIALVLRGDHGLNRLKAEKLPETATPLSFASPAEISRRLGCDTGSLGPLGINIPVIADNAVLTLADFICGANENGYHLTGVNWQRDLEEPTYADLRNVVDGDPAPDSSGPLKIARGIEVGHIFQLGTKYSEAMKANCPDETSEAVSLYMGCYGIGVSRIVAAAIEQNHDERGIIWPGSLAPYQLALIPINAHKSQRLRAGIEDLYQRLIDNGIEVLLDDRKERPGVMFTDMELLGIPHRFVFSERGLDNQTLEYKGRRDTQSTDIPLNKAVEFVKTLILTNMKPVKKL